MMEGYREPGRRLTLMPASRHAHWCRDQSGPRITRVRYR